MRTLQNLAKSAILPKVLVQGMANFARTEIRNEGLPHFLQTVLGSVVARDIRLVPDRTLGEELDVRAKRLGDRTFLVFEGQGHSYRAINDRAARVAQALTEIRVGRGGSVGILLPNLPAFLDIVFASQRVGACAVPINTALKDDGLRYILDNARVDVLFTTAELLPSYESIKNRLKKQPTVVIVPDQAGDLAPPNTIAYATMLRTAPQSSPDHAVPAHLPSLLMYTSGTTGHPKGVVYSYGHSQAKLTRISAHLLLTRDDVYYTCLPLFHANALMVTVFQCLFADAQVVLSRRFSASQFWREVRQSKATVFNTIGTMIAILMKAAPDPLDGQHSLRKVVSAACPAALWVPFQARFKVPLWEAFGAVDGGGFATFNLGNAPAGSIGKPLGRSVYRLVDETGADVPNEVPGELIHYVGHKKHAKVEYFENPGATEDKMRDGWIYSGDLMRRDAQGYLYFVGRKTDSMRCKGENISAMDVESAVDGHPQVLECAAFGVASDMGEQDVMVVVQPRDGSQIDPVELHGYLVTKLPIFAVPRYIRMVPELPKTGTHRTIKHTLKSEGVTRDTWVAPAPRRKVP